MEKDVIHGPVSLCTTDNCIKAPVIKTFDVEKDNLKTVVVHKDGRQVLATIDNVLSSSESGDIIERAVQHQFESMSNKYSSSQRNNSRVLVLDGDFASTLWELLGPHISKVLSDNDVTCQPLGFDVSRGKWHCEGLNEAFRINKYSANKDEFFSPHTDAQYCPNGDRRSLLTLLVYLNGEFNGGSTCFYFPKNQHCRKDISINEEIELSGGLENGYSKFIVKPSTGTAVIFSHNVIHESVPVTSGTKYVLKTDVVVTRQRYGFRVSNEEQEDYMKCLNYFREAQQQELKQNTLKAGELYERALSIRYSYPMALHSRNHNCQHYGENLVSILPSIVWHKILQCLSGFDIENLVRALPRLCLTQKAWERQRYNHDEKNKNKHRSKYIPSVELQYGIYTKFNFGDADFFFKNDLGCLRVAAMYAFFLLGHKDDERVYTVRYNPKTQEVCAVALKSLLTDAFLNRPCYGSIYAVKQTNAKGRFPVEDFGLSVDRAYMKLRYGAEVGFEVENSITAKTHLCLFGDESNVPDLKDHSDSNDGYMADSDIEVSDIADDKTNQKDLRYGTALSNALNIGEQATSQDVKTDAGNGDPKCFLTEPDSVPQCSSKVSFGVADDVPMQFDEAVSSSLSSSDTSSYKNEFNSIHQSGTVFQNKYVSYEGYDESDDAEDGDAQVSENSFDEEDLIFDIKEHIEANGSDDMFVTQYNGETSISSTVKVFRELIYNANISQTFGRSGKEVPARLGAEFHDRIYNVMEIGPAKFEGQASYNEIMQAICKKKFGVSAALVSVLKKPFIIKDDQMCFCNWPGGEAFDKVRKGCRTDFYNHLVFDFLNHQMNIKKMDGFDVEEEDDCFYHDYLDAFIKDELSLPSMLADGFHYRLDITDLLNESPGYNHASCNCHVPAFKIQEYFNLKSYPHLNHIHLVGGESDGHVTVWAIYGGIAAL